MGKAATTCDIVRSKWRAAYATPCEQWYSMPSVTRRRPSRAASESDCRRLPADHTTHECTLVVARPDHGTTRHRAALMARVSTGDGAIVWLMCCRGVRGRSYDCCSHARAAVSSAMPRYYTAPGSGTRPSSVRGPGVSLRLRLAVPEPRPSRHVCTVSSLLLSTARRVRLTRADVGRVAQPCHTAYVATQPARSVVRNTTYAWCRTTPSLR